MKKVRNSNIEVLRIISIVMIVVSHYCVHGIGRNEISYMDFGVNRFFLEFSILGNLGAILFVLISGYYLINSKEVKLKKILRIIFQVIFYSVAIYFILLILNFVPFGVKKTIKSIMPITFKEYWFATAYIIIYCFHPFINKLLNNLKKHEHMLMIILMFFFFSIMPTFTTGDFFGNELIQFLLFYSIGAFLYKYPDNILKKKGNNIKIAIASLLFIVLSIVFCDFVGIYKPSINSYSTFFLRRTSPVAIIFCTCLFDIFTKLKKREYKSINTIGSLMFGVYLISDNNHLKNIIWKDIFKCNEYINSPYILLHLIIVVLSVIIGCLAIEFIRKELIEKNIFRLLDNKIDSLQNKLTSRLNQIVNK